MLVSHNFSGSETAGSANLPFFGPTFAINRNCRTLAQSYSVLLFFEETFQFRNFLFKYSYFSIKNSLDQHILRICEKDLPVAWSAETFIFKNVKCSKVERVYVEREYIVYMSAAPLNSGSFDKKLHDPCVLLRHPSFCRRRNCRTLAQSNLLLFLLDK